LSGRPPEASLRELDRCVQDGPMVGVKLWVARRCHEAEIDPIIRRATELNAPILQHTWTKATGNLAGESTPADLAALAKRHPKASLICGHSGGGWAPGPRASRGAPNVGRELGGGDPTTRFEGRADRVLGGGRA